MANESGGDDALASFPEERTTKLGSYLFSLPPSPSAAEKEPVFTVLRCVLGYPLAPPPF